MLKSLKDTAIEPRPDFNQLRKAALREGKPDFVPFYELYINPEVTEAVSESLCPTPSPQSSSTIAPDTTTSRSGRP